MALTQPIALFPTLTLQHLMVLHVWAYRNSYPYTHHFPPTSQIGGPPHGSGAIDPSPVGYIGLTLYGGVRIDGEIG